MTPESFNAALAQRKLEAADILLKQAKTGSDADRIRAASAILRIAFFPVPSASSRCSALPTPASQAESLQVSSRRQSDESSRSAAAGEQPISSPTPQASNSPASPPLPLQAGEEQGEVVTTLCSQFTNASRNTPAPALSSA